VVHPDEGDDDNTGTLIIALLQRENRSNVAEGGQLLTIGYAVYKVIIASRSFLPTSRILQEVGLTRDLFSIYADRSIYWSRIE